MKVCVAGSKLRRDLCAQVGNADELAEKVLSEYVSEPGLLDILTSDVDVVGAQMQVARTQRPDAPLCLAREVFLLVARRCRRHHLIPMLIHRARCRRRQLHIQVQVH